MTAAAFLFGLWLACLLDHCFGDPRFLPHPVVLIARIAGRMESLFRASKLQEIKAGLLTVLCTLFLWGFGFILLFILLLRLSPWAFFLGAVYFLYASIARRGLADHAMEVHQALPAEPIGADLRPARERVGRIVGRDTSELDEGGIVRACVESIAENLSDGVIAPLFYAVFSALVFLFMGFGQYSTVGAAFGAMLYKVINTMDSIFGYKNERYLFFGRSAAILDDAANFIPARISGVILVAAAFLTKHNPLASWKIMCRDGRQHASPNAGYPEAAMAGALGVQLGGRNRYFGEIMEKPTIGDRKCSPEKKHISDAVLLMNASSLLACLFFSLLYAASVGLYCRV